MNVMVFKIEFTLVSGIIGAEGDSWYEQRKFAIATLKEFGMGKNLMEEKVSTAYFEF